MRFKIEVAVQSNKEDKDKIDVQIRRLGRVSREYSTLAVALHFGVTNEVRRILGDLAKLAQKDE